MPFTTPGGIGLSYLLDIGLWLYDIMAGRRGVRLHRRLSREQVMQLAPSMVTQGLKNGFIYYDAQTNDARLTMALIRTAARFGATIANYAEVTSFVLEDDKVRGAHVTDLLQGQQVTIRARHIVNATGIYSEQVEALTGAPPQVKIVPSKGVHLVFSRKDLKMGNDAIVLPETDDKRLLFIVPWESRVVVGTTDTGSGDLDHPLATHEDVAYILHYLNRYLSINLTADNIISTYAGYRPLVKPANASQSSAKLSRTHAVLQSPSDLVTIVGGKLTTYRRMAQDTVDVLSRRDGAKPVHPTESLPLQGSAGWPKRQKELQKRGARLGLSGESITHLGHSYGNDADIVMDLIAENAGLGERLIEDLPYLRAEVIYACRHEMAMTPYDILARRTSITLEDRDRGMGVVEEVAALMAQELHWTPEQQRSLIEAYRTPIQQQMDAEVAV
jgi:glycerol-3-phosphate dehydrogenase